MRGTNLAMMTIVALLASSSSAFALDVNKHIAAPAQLLVVWSTISAHDQGEVHRVRRYELQL